MSSIRWQSTTDRLSNGFTRDRKFFAEVVYVDFGTYRWTLNRKQANGGYRWVEVGEATSMKRGQADVEIALTGLVN